MPSTLVAISASWLRLHAKKEPTHHVACKADGHFRLAEVKGYHPLLQMFASRSISPLLFGRISRSQWLHTWDPSASVRLAPDTPVPARCFRTDQHFWNSRYVVKLLSICAAQIDGRSEIVRHVRTPESGWLAAGQSVERGELIAK